jgi:type 1 glutamine amidotransferase
LVLVSGPKDHGPGEHDYPAWQKSWKHLLGKAEGVRVETAGGWPDHDQWRRADLIVFYFWNHSWTAERYKELDAFLAHGGGVVVLHAAMIADKEPEKLAERFGLAAQPVRTKYRHGPLELVVAVDANHPITRGLTKVRFVDETYWPPVGDTKRVEVLATAVEEGKPWPMLWTYTIGKGRVCCSVLGHYAWTFDDPLFRLMVLRGMAWAAGESAHRFEPLTVEGVTLRSP